MKLKMRIRYDLLNRAQRGASGQRGPKKNKLFRHGENTPYRNQNSFVGAFLTVQVQVAFGFWLGVCFQKRTPLPYVP